MDKTRSQKIKFLLSKLKEYWGLRAISQVNYLEEMLKSGMLKDDTFANEITDWLYNRYREEGAIGKKDVTELEKALEPVKAIAKSIAVPCIGHAHIDMNWMWTFDETVMVTIDTFRTMLQLMKEYPDFTFMQSQASVYKIIEEYAPELLPEIIDRIKKGQWEVTASTWVETDKNMPNGESLTRHLLYTKRYLKNLLALSDDDFRIDFEPDTFGHNAQVPEILRTGGVKYYYHCRGYHEHSLYKWEAPSGATVTVLREPTWYNDTIDYSTFLYVPAYCGKHELDRVCHVYGVGDHGGGATRRDIERIMDMAKWPCMPDLKFGRLIDYFNYLETKDLPVVRSELNFVFDGCYTTQTRIKKANRTAERMLGEAEALNVFAGLCNLPVKPQETFTSAWENVLFGQFHDILPGSGVIGTREYAMGMFQKTMATTASAVSSAVRQISSCINNEALLPECEVSEESFSEGAGAGFDNEHFVYTSAAGYTGGSKRLFTVFNPSSADYSGLVDLTVWDWEHSVADAVIRNEDKHLLPSRIKNQLTYYWGHIYFTVSVLLDIPAFGYRTVLLEESAEDFSSPIPADSRKDDVEEYVLENDLLRAEFDHETLMLKSFLDKKTGKEMLSLSASGKYAPGGGFYYTIEDGQKGMSSWKVGRHTGNNPLISNVRIKKYEKDLLSSFLTFEAEVSSSKVLVTVSLDKDSRTLRYSTKCMWREIGEEGKGIPHLRFCLPLPSEERRKYTYDTPFAPIVRDSMEYDLPSCSFVYAPSKNEAPGIMLVTDSKYGFRCTDELMSVTLIRSSYDPDNLPEIYDHEFNIGISVPESSDTAGIYRNAISFNVKPVTMPAAAGKGKLPLAGQFLKFQGEIMISSIKQAEDDNGIIVRVCGLPKGSGVAKLTWLSTPVKAHYVDAHEKSLPGEIYPDGNSVTFPVKPYEIVAIKIMF